VLNTNYNRFIDNNIRQFVIPSLRSRTSLNEVKNLFLLKCTFSSFVGQMLRFAQHDNKKPVGLSNINAKFFTKNPLQGKD